MEDLLLHKGTLIAAAVIALLINVFLAAGRLLGLKALLQVLSGRYHRPRREEHLIAFVDVRGATTIAEKLGDFRFQALVDVFGIIEVTAMERGGEVHDYIGDSVMVSRPALRRRRAANSHPFHWIIDVHRTIDACRVSFMEQYGVCPDIRIRMHVGPVIVGEVGVFRTKLSCLGDAVNTAARVEQLARD